MAKTAVGFRVKSGWAAAVVLSGPSSSPSVLHSRGIELSDPAVPDSRQPYHAVDDAQGDLEPDDGRIRERVRVVRRAAAQSIGELLKECRANGWNPERAGIVTGSLSDPSTILSPHIRAHAMEGHLFRTVARAGVHRARCEVRLQGGEPNDPPRRGHPEADGDQSRTPLRRSVASGGKAGRARGVGGDFGERVRIVSM